MNLSMAACNVNGIKGKFDSLESMLQAAKAHIALITETKLPEKINKHQMIQMDRKNRKNRTGGGVGILVAQEIG